MKPTPASPLGRHFARFTCALCLVSSFWLLAGCGDDDDGAAGPTATGQACTSVDQCYPGVKDGELVGEAVCLDRVEGGYCTHHCSTDADCCAVAGECSGPYSEVCSPFESTDDLFCFISCEDDEWDGAKWTDADAYCANYAGPTFHCRSTGGGSANRKVCMP